MKGFPPFVCRDRLGPRGRLSIRFIAWLDLAGRTADRMLPFDLFPERALSSPIEGARAADPHVHLGMLEDRSAD